MKRKNIILLCVVLAVILCVGVYATIYLNKETLVIFDGVATITLPKSISQNFQRSLGSEKPAVTIRGLSSFFLAAPNNAAITKFTITPTSQFVMPTNIKDYLLAERLLPHIDEVKDEKITTKENTTTMSAVVTNYTAIDFPTYKFVLNVVTGKNYVITSITQVYEQNIRSSESNKWLSYMSSLALADNEKVNWENSRILPENLKYIASLSIDAPLSSYTLERDNLAVSVSLPSTFPVLSHDDWFMNISSDDQKFSAEIFITDATSLEDFMYLADYDFYIQKLSNETYTNVTRSTTQELNNGNTRYFKVDYTYEVVIDGGVTTRDCSQIVAGTSFSNNGIYGLNIGYYADDLPDFSDEELIELLSLFSL